MSDISERIIQLRNKVPENGATEGEAMASLAMAERLMEKYGITEEDLRRTEFTRDMAHVKVHQRVKQQHPASKFCGTIIERFCGIRGWWSQREQAANYFGYEGDVLMAEFLHELIRDSMDRGWKEFLRNNPQAKSNRHREYWSFMLGFGLRINERLEELMAERETYRESTTGTDLVEVKMALVEEGMAAMLPDIRLKQSTSKGIRADTDALRQGGQAGDKVNLNRPMEGRTSRKRIT